MVRQQSWVIMCKFSLRLVTSKRATEEWLCTNFHSNLVTPIYVRDEYNLRRIRITMEKIILLNGPSG